MRGSRLIGLVCLLVLAGAGAGEASRPADIAALRADDRVSLRVYAAGDEILLCLAPRPGARITAVDVFGASWARRASPAPIDAWTPAGEDWAAPDATLRLVLSGEQLVGFRQMRIEIAACRAGGCAPSRFDIPVLRGAPEATLDQACTGELR